MRFFTAVNERSMVFHDSTEDPWLERKLEILAKVTKYLTCKLIHTCKQRYTIKVLKRHPRITITEVDPDEHQSARDARRRAIYNSEQPAEPVSESDSGTRIAEELQRQEYEQR